MVVVEVGLAANLNDGQRLPPEDTDRDFPTGDERFDHAIAKFSSHPLGGGHRLTPTVDDVHANAAALPDRLDHKPLPKRLQLLLASCGIRILVEFQNRRHFHAGLCEELFADHLVERSPAGLGTAAHVDQAAILEDLLKLPVLAELAVQSREEDVDVPPVEDLHIIRADIRGNDVLPALPQRLGDTPAALQAYVTLAPDAAP